jgi:hypothetical protein
MGVFFFLCENPKRSLMWRYPAFVKLLAECGVCGRDFQHCAWGGKRDKWGKFATNIAELEQIVKVCDGKHAHEPWGYSFKLQGFHTQEEAEYPEELCVKLADILFHRAQAAGARASTESLRETGEAEQTATIKKQKILNAMSANRQPRGKLVPPVISEFAVNCFRSQGRCFTL